MVGRGWSWLLGHERRVQSCAASSGKRRLLTHYLCCCCPQAEAQAQAASGQPFTLTVRAPWADKVVELPELTEEQKEYIAAQVRGGDRKSVV